LRAPASGEVCVGVVADGWLPAHTVVDVKVCAVRDAAPIRLRAGTAIAGQLRVNGAAPGRPARVYAYRTDPGRRVGGVPAGWRDGALARARAEAATDDDGRFTIAGLTPGGWKVRATAVEHVHPDVWQIADARTVEAPGAGVDIDLDVAWLALAVDAGTTPELGVAGRTCFLVARVPDGLLEIGAAPGISYDVEARAPNHRTMVRRVVAPERGHRREERFELEREPPRATLVARFDGESPLFAGFGFFADGGAHAAFERDAESADGRFVLVDLPPGRYRVVALANQWWGYPLGFALPAEAEVTLAPGGKAEVRFDVRPGGRLLLHTASKDGCAVELRDAASGVVPMKVYHRDAGGGLSYGPSVRPEPGETGPALAPGSYRLTASAPGFLSRTYPVEIRAGDVTDVEIALERE
jgi:hypothetical protein